MWIRGLLSFLRWNKNMWICNFMHLVHEVSQVWDNHFPKLFSVSTKIQPPKNHFGYKISEKTKICCASAPERKSTELEKRDSKTWDDHREWSSNQVMKDFVRQRKGLGFCSVGWLIELLKQVSESWSLNFHKYCEPVFKHHPHSRLN